MVVYIGIGFALLLSVFALYRYTRTATRKQSGTLIVIIGTIMISALVFLLALTGKLPAFVGGLAAFWPLLYSLWSSHKQVTKEEEIHDSISASVAYMTEGEAYEILGLEMGASEDEINKAHQRLIALVHPDKKGSAWLADKVNAARQRLLG